MLRRWDVSTELDGEARKHSGDDRVDGTFFKPPIVFLHRGKVIDRRLEEMFWTLKKRRLFSFSPAPPPHATGHIRICKRHAQGQGPYLTVPATGKQLAGKEYLLSLNHLTSTLRCRESSIELDNMMSQ
jgi:hypothetical protein